MSHTSHSNGVEDGELGDIDSEVSESVVSESVVSEDGISIGDIFQENPNPKEANGGEDDDQDDLDATEPIGPQEQPIPVVDDTEPQPIPGRENDDLPPNERVGNAAQQPDPRQALARRNREDLYYCWAVLKLRGLKILLQVRTLVGVPFFFFFGLLLWVFPSNSLIGSVLELVWKVLQRLMFADFLEPKEDFFKPLTVEEKQLLQDLKTSEQDPQQPALNLQDPVEENAVAET